jgi:hypothetical protein
VAAGNGIANAAMMKDMMYKKGAAALRFGAVGM